MRVFQNSVMLLVIAAIVLSGISAAQQQVTDARTLAFIGNLIGHYTKRSDIVRIDAQGTITYQWTNREVSGPAELTVTNDGRVVLTSNVDNKSRTAKINRLGGSVIEGSSDSIITTDAAARLESLGVPFMITWLTDYPGTIKIGSNLKLGSRKLTAVILSREQRSRHIANITAYVDSTSLDLVFIEIEPTDGSGISSRFVFSDLRDIGGALIPFSIAEQVNGQTTWRLQLRSAQINSSTNPLEF